MMKAAVLVLPGSNCDHDCYHALKHVVGVDTQLVWHKETELPPVDLVVIPGGFSHGDYLRAGAIARFAPVMEAVARHAARGGYVLGICNGFQILTEAHLLPGALLRNHSQKFVCQDVDLRVEHAESALTAATRSGQTLTIPIAHTDGRFVVDPDGLRRLEGEGQVLLRYLEPDGSVAHYASVNGSLAGVAAIMNAGGNVFGMMPHPERAAEALVGGPSYYDPSVGGGQNTDGLLVLKGLVARVGAAR